jgi:hypothetical protein
MEGQLEDPLNDCSGSRACLAHELSIVGGYYALLYCYFDDPEFQSRLVYQIMNEHVYTFDT